MLVDVLSTLGPYLAALAVGLLFYRQERRKKAAEADTQEATARSVIVSSAADAVTMWRDVATKLEDRIDDLERRLNTEIEQGKRLRRRVRVLEQFLRDNDFDPADINGEAV